MNTKQRIMLLRLFEKQQRNKKITEEIGVEVKINKLNNEVLESKGSYKK